MAEEVSDLDDDEFEDVGEKFDGTKIVHGDEGEQVNCVI